MVLRIGLAEVGETELWRREVEVEVAAGVNGFRMAVVGGGVGIVVVWCF